MPKQRTVLCIQDLSCVGRSSLAAVLPTLAATGAAPCALPTALLSTHFGGLGTPACSDESAFALAALEHYGRLGLSFHCVYSGYLSTAQQAQLVERAYAQSPAALRVADPAVADHGKLYSAVTPEVCAAQARLCAQADIIVPNATEAALLLQKDGAKNVCGVRAAHHAVRHAALLLERFPRLRCAVVTGAARGRGRRGNVCAVRGAEPVFLPYEALPQEYPGTGDLFAAAFTGTLLAGCSERSAVCTAARFVFLAVRSTLRAGADPRFGVRFEPLLGALAEWVQRPLQY